LEGKEPFSFFQGKIGTKRTKLEGKNVSICSRMKMEQKRTFLFTPGKSGTKRNKSFFYIRFDIDVEHILLRQGESGTKRNDSICFRKKLERKRRFIYIQAKVERKETFLLLLETQNEEK
jgi:hypothetical protein